ncbi:OmpP1/FadL family transporter [Desulfonema ishimotonii]|nr:outer membrane protein transport protein [Desulfonema ishimotonii]
MFFIIFPYFAQASEKLELPSSPNPVGSGARALGMGGAFIAVADDATSASWNPGGLIQVKRPEYSVVLSSFHRIEDNAFGKYPEASGDQNVSDVNLNYASLTYPFDFLKRNMAVSLNYQHLFDFSREWDFSYSYQSSRLKTHRTEDFEREGQLYALGLAYCIQVTPKFSFGVTLNLWNDWFNDNEWHQKEYRRDQDTHIASGDVTETEYTWRDEYSFDGINANIGFLWNITDHWTVGAVLKTPFTGDLHHKSTFYSSLSQELQVSSGDAELDMPMSYGIGVAWHPTDQLTVSADIYRTEWDDFILEDADGSRTSMVSGLAESESDVDPTCQVRAGAEYLFLFPEKGYVVPLRGGVFYDPAPAEGSSDDFYGFSLGTGFAKSPYVFDIAYQYRFSWDVNEYLLPSLDFSQDVDEHTLYVSFIYHF